MVNGKREVGFNFIGNVLQFIYFSFNCNISHYNQKEYVFSLRGRSLDIDLRLVLWQDVYAASDNQTHRFILS